VHTSLPTHTNSKLHLSLPPSTLLGNSSVTTKAMIPLPLINLITHTNCDPCAQGIFGLIFRLISKIVTQVVSMLVPASYSNMRCPLYVPLCPHLFVSWDICAKLGEERTLEAVSCLFLLFLFSFCRLGMNPKQIEYTDTQLTPSIWLANPRPRTQQNPHHGGI